MTTDAALPDQYAAWSFYGLPATAIRDTRLRRARPVGEVGYIVGWLSDQLSRLDWTVRVDGRSSWTVQTAEGSITSDDKVKDTERPTHPVTASSALLDLVGWSEQVVKQLAVNLFVAGECHYVADRSDDWRVVSVIKPKRKVILEESVHAIRALWPHPADSDAPNAPLFSALPILSQLDWLTRLSEAQSSTRVGMRGVVGIADTMATANGKDFWEELKDATQANMSDPDNLAPVVIRGPEELVKSSGDGMAGFSWVIPEFPYDEKIDERIVQAIQRLAYSLPIPPEILLGLQAQSKATAFQVEESAYRAHIEPPAHLVALVAAQALSLLLDRKVTVEADATALLARRHSVQDVLDAYDRGAVSLPYVRSVLGIPENAAATDEDLEILYRLKGRSDAEAAVDPGNAAAEPPAPSQSALLAALSPEARSLLAETGDVDLARLLFLSGATQQACDRARERVGAKARTHEELRDLLAPEIPNAQVAAALTVPRLLEAGVAVDECVLHAIESLTSTVPGLEAPLLEHVLGTLEDEESLPLPDMVLTCLMSG